MKLDFFGAIDKRVMEDPRISTTAKALYAYLCCFVNNHTDQCYVSVERIATDLNMSNSTVSRHIKALTKHSVITRIETPRVFATISRINHGEFLQPSDGLFATIKV